MKALIFDVDDTLYDLAAPFYRACNEIIPGLDEIILEKLFISSRTYSDVYLNQFFEGKISKSEMFKYRNRDAFLEHGIEITDDQIDKLEELYRKYQNDIKISNNIKKMFEKLDKNWTLGIITNGQVKHQMNKIKVLGLDNYIPEKNIFVSEALGVSKPNKEAFLKPLKQMELNPKDCIYIGDTFGNDVEGSLNAGLNSLWYNHRNLEGFNSKAIEVNNEEDFINTILNLKVD